MGKTFDEFCEAELNAGALEYFRKHMDVFREHGIEKGLELLAAKELKRTKKLDKQIDRLLAE